MNKLISTLALVSAFTGANAIAVAEPVVGQKDKQFTMKELKVKVGDAVTFTNEDPFSHNIYSLSEVMTFDLGSFPQGESRSVTFDNVGTVEVNCAVHMDMSMVITVE